MTAVPSNPDVIVVGAGTAGLSAAKSLMSRGFEVLVLEADGHVGGRCITDTSTFSTAFDRGASWLHSASINPLARLAETDGAQLHKARWDWHWVHRDGAALADADVEAYSQYQQQMWRAIKIAGHQSGDVSTESVLPPSTWQETARHWVPQMLGGDADATSATDVARYQDGDGDWMVGGGLGAFIRHLHSEVAVNLNCPVTEIDTTGKTVRAVTPQGTAEARALVLTVSTGVLCAERIRFVPNLPDRKQAAIEQLPNGLLNKVGLEFDPRWTAAHQGQSADYQANGEAFCSLFFGLFDTNMAVGFVSGRFADLLETEGAGAATEFCLQGLRAVFGNDVTRHLLRTCETAWRSNEFTVGSYSFARPGGADARAVLAETVDGRLFFAGEATVPDAYATVHGAYRSGLEAANRVAATLR